MQQEQYLNEERQPKRKKKKKKHKVYAFFVLLFGFAIIILTLFIIFHLQSIEIEGNNYASDTEIAEAIQNDEYSINTLYIMAKYALGYGEQPPCLNSMKFSLSRPWVLKVTVKEKPIIGYVQNADGECYFFDEEGFVVFKSTSPIDGIPLVEGIEVDQLELYKKMRSENSTIFGEILETSQEMIKYELSVDKIMCQNDRIYVYIGNICVSLGSNITSEKVAQIPPIMEKLEGKAGTLHLENYSEERSTITFKIAEDTQDDTEEGTQE